MITSISFRNGHKAPSKSLGHLRLRELRRQPLQKFAQKAPQPPALKPPSTARTAGRSDWAERRFRRQPFILLSFSSPKNPRKAPKGSPQNSHTARSITDYKRCHFHSHSSISVLLWTFSHKRLMFAFTHTLALASKIVHSGSQGQTGGASARSCSFVFGLPKSCRKSVRK